MKHFHVFWSVLFGLFVFGSTAFAEVRIDPVLRDFINSSGSQKKTVVVVMDPSAERIQTPRKYQRSEVVRYLQTRAKASWREVALFLDREDAFRTGDVKIKRVFWINSSFSAEVTPEGLRTIASSPLVSKIYFNRKGATERPLKRVRPRPPIERDLPYAFKDSGLAKVMTEMPELTGEGVVIGSVDTGVDGAHPALKTKIKLFYDGVKRQTTDPYDTDGHGTHTAGTMVGGDRNANLIGMAPSAQLVAAGGLDDYDSMIRGMEFMLDPDSNPDTADMPRAVNNSWNCQGAPDIELFYRAITSWEAAGILPVFSAGNAGPGDRTITPPHEHPSVIAVGATGEDGKITDFSSRGPGRFRGSDTEKPDMTAPGDEIFSSVPGGRYSRLSGTSMAAPHVTGATALILQVEPKLNPAQVKEILIKTTVGMSEDGEVYTGAGRSPWNKVYGLGKLDIYAAVKLAAELSRANRGLGQGILNLENLLFRSPRDIDVKRFFADAPSFAGWDDQIPSSTEGDHWIHY